MYTVEFERMKKIFRRWNNDSEVHFLKMKSQKI